MKLRPLARFVLGADSSRSQCARPCRQQQLRAITIPTRSVPYLSSDNSVDRRRQQFFSTSSRYNVGSDAAAAQNHYEVLRLPPSATPADLKKQFYILSKETHPDHNRHDPHASERFSQISESYSVLADPEKRKRYDRDVMRGSSRSEHGRSTSSSSSYAGSRPASGLSKRRSAFRGPPPSYYSHGKPSSNTAQNQSASSGNNNNNNEGPSPADNLNAHYTYDSDPSPYSTASVYRTQTVEDTRRRDRRAAAMAAAQAEAEDYAANFWAQFVVVTGIVVLGVTAGSLFVNTTGDGAPRTRMGGVGTGAGGGRLSRADGSSRRGTGGGAGN